MPSLFQLNSHVVSVVQKDVQDSLLKEMNNPYKNRAKLKALQSAFQHASALSSILSSIPEPGGMKC